MLMTLTTGGSVWIRGGDSPVRGAAQIEVTPPTIPDAVRRVWLSLPHGVDAPESETAALETLLRLTARQGAAILQTPGWVHMIVRHERYRDRVSTLPGGREVPSVYLSDTWYRLEEGGWVTAAVARMLSEQGAVIQVSVYHDGLWRNLTTGEQWQGEPFRFRPDLGFAADALRADSHGETLNGERVFREGRAALQFTLRTDFATPILMEGVRQPVVAAGRRAYLDPDSGALMALEQVLIPLEGENRVVLRATPLLLERAEPSTEVLQHLEAR